MGKKRNRNPSSPNTTQLTSDKQYKKPNNRSSEEEIGLIHEASSSSESDRSPEVSPSPSTTNTIVRMADLTNVGAILRNCLLEPDTVDAFRKIMQPILDQQTEVIVEKQTKVMNEKIASLEHKNKLLEEKVTSMEIKMDKLEQYSRKTNVIIVGMEAGQHTSVKTDVLELFNKNLGTQLVADHIEAAHPLGKNSSATIVRLRNNDIKSNIMKTKGKLRNIKPIMYINDDLTRNRMKIFSKARMEVKAKTIQSAYTRNGLIYIKVSEGSIPIEINSLDDINRYASTCETPDGQSTDQY